MDNRLLIYGEPSYLLEKTSLSNPKPLFLDYVGATGEHNLIGYRSVEGRSRLKEIAESLAEFAKEHNTIELDTISKPREVEKLEEELIEWLNVGIKETNKRSIYMHDCIPLKLLKER